MMKIKHAVITGSSRGIGFGLAREFLKTGYSVTISGRNSENLKEAVEILAKEFDPELIFSYLCDVRINSQIEDLYESAFKRFGRIDIWVNNAGIGQDYKYLLDLDEQDINDLIDINLKALVHCSRIVLGKMNN